MLQLILISILFLSQTSTLRQEANNISPDSSRIVLEDSNLSANMRYQDDGLNTSKSISLESKLALFATILAPFFAVLASFSIERYLESRREKKTVKGIYAVISAEISENCTSVKQLRDSMKSEIPLHGTPAQRLATATRLAKTPRMTWSRRMFNAQMANLPSSGFDENSLPKIYRHYLQMEQADKIHNELIDLINKSSSSDDFDQEDLILLRLVEYVHISDELWKLGNPI